MRSEPKQGRPLSVVIITGDCCIPGMAPLDAEAQRIVDAAMIETGVSAEVHIIPASKAMFGALPPSVLREVSTRFNESGVVPLPAVIVNGAIVSYGVPALESMKSILDGSRNDDPEEGDHDE